MKSNHNTTRTKSARLGEFVLVEHSLTDYSHMNIISSYFRRSKEKAH
jgi:hypothetical protein